MRGGRFRRRDELGLGLRIGLRAALRVVLRVALRIGFMTSWRS